MTHPGDVIAGGSGGMGPCPLAQLEPPGIFVYVLYIQCIFMNNCQQILVYNMYIPRISADSGIYMTYTWYIHGIFIVYFDDIGI